MSAVLRAIRLALLTFAVLVAIWPTMIAGQTGGLA